MGLCNVPLSMSLLGFGMGTMLANFHMCGIILVLRAVFNMVVRNVLIMFIILEWNHKKHVIQITVKLAVYIAHSVVLRFSPSCTDRNSGGLYILLHFPHR